MSYIDHIQRTYGEESTISTTKLLEEMMKTWDFKQKSVNTEKVEETINLLHDIIISLTFFEKLHTSLETNEDITDENIKDIYDLEVKWNENIAWTHIDDNTREPP